MFNPFRVPSIVDAQLGELRRKRGLWRGAIVLGHSPVPLAIHGSRTGPDPEALRMARAVVRSLDEWRPHIEQALFEHYSPYADAIAAGEAEPPAGGLPPIRTPSGVWPHAAVEFVQVTPLDGLLAVEIGYRVAWDEEHTLGARFRDDRFLGLCGSVLAP